MKALFVRRKAMTLAEVLVVLSILALLGALLFPTLHHAIRSTEGDMIAEQLADECTRMTQEARRFDEARWILFTPHGYTICDANKKPLRQVVLAEDITLVVRASNASLTQSGNGFCVSPDGRWSRYGRVEIQHGKKGLSQFVVSSEGYMRKKS